MRLAFHSAVCLGMIAVTALGEPPQGFDTTGHPLKVKVPPAVLERAKSAMLASAAGSPKCMRTYNLPEGDAAREQRREFFESRLRVCGAVKQYRIKYTPDTLTESTPVTAFVDWRDSSYQVYMCIGDSVVRGQGIMQHYGKIHRGAGGEGSTLSEMERVLAVWPPAEGYNPVFVKWPGASWDWFFHLPEVDSYNLTVVADTVDYRNLEYSRFLFNRPQTRRYLKRCADRRRLILEKMRKEYENENQ